MAETMIMAKKSMPLLRDELALFFSERCYLAQSTLGRLLEIYQFNDGRQGESPLTRFVKDQLGIDPLDALIEGLHVAGDVRRVRQTVPQYREAEEKRQSLEESKENAKKALAELEKEAGSLLQRLSEKIRQLDPEANLSVEQPANLKNLLASDIEEQLLMRLTRARREIEVLRSEWQRLSAEETAAEQQAVEEEDRVARAALEAWRSHTGQSLEALIENLRGMFADLPSPASTDPEYARANTLKTVRAELERCVRQLSQDEADAAKIAELDQNLVRKNARLATLTQQLSKLAGDAEGLARVLTELLPYIHTNDCPVCSRDYSEISSESLIAHVAAQTAHLTERAERIQALSKERANAGTAIRAAQRERDELVSRCLTQETCNNLKMRQVQLTEAVTKLESLATAAVEGANLLRHAAQSSRQLANLRERDQRVTQLRQGVARLVADLDQPTSDKTEPIGSTLERLNEYIDLQEKRLNERQQLRREANTEWQCYIQLDADIKHRKKAFEDDGKRLEQVQAAISLADNRMKTARKLAQETEAVRNTIVHRVFNKSLNTIWRELFIRLAPEEPFVPVFALPKSSKDADVMLETIHRNGNRGGNPGAMLSTGNLNTAALTLFLALHLSVEPKLPWLVLDDPVQCMDEVRISQFAALLRMLSKMQGRQILIAVHEKPLFDYLTLELSPSFQEDRLITVELERDSNGNTIAKHDVISWEPDKAVA
jgi:exonuclease SbcC